MEKSVPFIKNNAFISKSISRKILADRTTQKAEPHATHFNCRV